MLRSRASRIRTLGAVRLVVGLALVVSPRRLTGMDDPSSALLVRTIGIRDLVLGAGAAIPSVGRLGGSVAALVPVPFLAAGIWAARGRRDGGAR